MGARINENLGEKKDATLDEKLSMKLGSNKDVTKDAKKDAIEVVKLGANKGVTKDVKNWVQKWTQKWMLKGRKKICNRWCFTKLYNSARFSVGLFTKIGKKLH